MNYLAKQFDLKTMTHSDTAVRYKIDNTPSTEETENLKLLYENILLPLCEALPGQINVTNAFRCHALNAKVGGKPASQHTTGKAADIEYYENDKENNPLLIAKIKELKLPIDQCIDEYGRWIHVSYNHGKNRGQFLKL